MDRGSPWLARARLVVAVFGEDLGEARLSIARRGRAWIVALQGGTGQDQAGCGLTWIKVGHCLVMRGVVINRLPGVFRIAHME